MFINKLIEFNEKKLTQYNLVFKFMKVYSFLFLLFIIACSIAIVWLILLKELIYLLIPVVIYFLSIYVFSKKIKKVILNIHNVKINSVIGWSGWTNYKVKLLKVYLKQNNCLEKNKIREYVEFLEKEAVRKKPSNYLIFGIPGLLLALFVPAWNNFNNWVFVHLISSIEVGFAYIILITIIIFLISILLGILKTLGRDIFESNYRKINDLIYLLDLVTVSFNEPVIDDTILQKINE